MCDVIRRTILPILGIILFSSIPGCGDAAGPEADPEPVMEMEPASPRDEIIGFYELQTIDGDSLPLIFEPVTGDSARITAAYFNFGLDIDSTEFIWTLFVREPSMASSEQAREGPKLPNRGTWSVEETHIELEWEDGTVDTGRVDFSTERLTLIIRSHGVEWTYECTFHPPV